MIPLGTPSGDSYSRANGFRPAHDSMRRLYVWSLICFASLALMLFAGSISYWSQPKATVDAIGSLVLAVGFGTLAFFCCIHLATDCVRRRYLESVSRHDLRRRLRATPKSRKYVADPIHLRSMRIGGLFFGGCAIVALTSKLLGLSLIHI